MTGDHKNTLLQHLRKVLDPQTACDLSDGEAHEIHDGSPPMFLGTGFTEVRAGQVFSFGLLQNGTLEELNGNNPIVLSDPTSAAHPPKVTSFTLGLDLSGANVVDAVFADGTTKVITPGFV